VPGVRLTVQWFREEEEIRSDDKHKCSFYENVAFLEISGVDGTESGRYTCMASNRARSERSSGTVVVTERCGRHFLSGNTLCERFILVSLSLVFTLFRPPYSITPVCAFPFFTDKPEGVSVVRVGGNQGFECQVGGSPPISVRWFRDGAEIHQSAKHQTAFKDSALEIREVSEHDGGKYFCEASSEAGTESCSVELEVIGWCPLCYRYILLH